MGGYCSSGKVVSPRVARCTDVGSTGTIKLHTSIARILGNSIQLCAWLFSWTIFRCPTAALIPSTCVVFVVGNPSELPYTCVDFGGIKDQALTSVL